MSLSQFSERGPFYRVAAVALVAMFFGAVGAQAQNVPPRLKNLFITSPIIEASYATLTGSIRDANAGDSFKLTINWGDGTAAQVFSYPAGTLGFTNYHFYADDTPTNTPGDIFTVTLKLADNHGGVFKTNLSVVVTNALDASLYITSPIDQNAPATLRGLDVTEFLVPTAGAFPQGIAAGPDGAIWFTETAANKIGRVTTDGVVTEFPIVGGTIPIGITAGPDNRLWFTCNGSGQIGRITTNGVIRLFTIPYAAGEPSKFPLYITSA